MRHSGASQAALCILKRGTCAVPTFLGTDIYPDNFSAFSAHPGTAEVRKAVPT